MAIDYIIIITKSITCNYAWSRRHVWCSCGFLQHEKGIENRDHSYCRDIVIACVPTCVMRIIIFFVLYYCNYGDRPKRQIILFVVLSRHAIAESCLMVCEFTYSDYRFENFTENNYRTVFPFAVLRRRCTYNNIICTYMIYYYYTTNNTRYRLISAKSLYYISFRRVIY